MEWNGVQWEWSGDEGRLVSGISEWLWSGLIINAANPLIPLMLKVGRTVLKVGKKVKYQPMVSTHHMNRCLIPHDPLLLRPVSLYISSPLSLTLIPSRSRSVRRSPNGR